MLFDTFQHNVSEHFNYIEKSKHKYSTGKQFSHPGHKGTQDVIIHILAYDKFHPHSDRA